MTALCVFCIVVAIVSVINAHRHAVNTGAKIEAALAAEKARADAMVIELRMASSEQSRLQSQIMGLKVENANLSEQLKTSRYQQPQQTAQEQFNEAMARANQQRQTYYYYPYGTQQQANARAQQNYNPYGDPAADFLRSFQEQADGARAEIRRTAPRPAWERVLGPCKTREAAEAAYRTEAKKQHPDLGGSSAAMAELNEAIKQARLALPAGG